MFLDAASCDRCYVYRGLCVCVLLHLSMDLMSCAEMAEPIEMPFRGMTHEGPRKHVLDKGVEIPIGRGNFGGCPAH